MESHQLKQDNNNYQKNTCTTETRRKNRIFLKKSNKYTRNLSSIITLVWIMAALIGSPNQRPIEFAEGRELLIVMHIETHIYTILVSQIFCRSLSFNHYSLHSHTINASLLHIIYKHYCNFMDNQ